jgi:SAM-dependent methyltransferase
MAMKKLPHKIEDAVSARVGALYESYSYPPPIDDLAALVAKNQVLTSDPSVLSAQFWPEGRPREDLSILVAGCGTNQAAFLAYRNPQCLVTGLDLSAASLAHERFLRDKHQIHNLDLVQDDLLNVGALKKDFDLIVCTGVLHHMRDPDEGLRALAPMLRPNGTMYLMVYARARRAGIYLLQDAFRRLGVESDEAGVRFVRDVLKGLPKEHYAHLMTGFRGADADIIDTFLHPQDRAYSVPEVLDFVDRADLAFMGWQDNGLYYPDRYVARDTDLQCALARVPGREQWAIIENLSIAMLKHDFLACRRDRDARDYQIDFTEADWTRYIPVRHPGMQVHALADGRTKALRAGAEVMLNKIGAFLLAQVDGKGSIRQILDHPSFASNSEDDRIAHGREFFSRMWRLGYLFYLTQTISRARTA